jgi:hypothetical protein
MLNTILWLICSFWKISSHKKPALEKMAETLKNAFAKVKN